MKTQVSDEFCGQCGGALEEWDWEPTCPVCVHRGRAKTQIRRLVGALRANGRDNEAADLEQLVEAW